MVWQIIRRSDGTALTSDVIVLTTSTDTLTNKTLTSPVLDGAPLQLEVVT